jgi:hypothetical protein
MSIDRDWFQFHDFHRFPEIRLVVSEFTLFTVGIEHGRAPL